MRRLFFSEVLCSVPLSPFFGRKWVPPGTCGFALALVAVGGMKTTRRVVGAAYPETYTFSLWYRPCRTPSLFFFLSFSPFLFLMVSLLIMRTPFVQHRRCFCCLCLSCRFTLLRYATSFDGVLIVDDSSLIHDFYTGECERPVHLVVDTALKVCRCMP